LFYFLPFPPLLSPSLPLTSLQVAEKAYDIQTSVRQKLQERTELQTTVTLMEQERERHKRLKKDLSNDKLAELANLRLVSLEKRRRRVPATTWTSTPRNNKSFKGEKEKEKREG
jgi:hypothetical protein